MLAPPIVRTTRQKMRKGLEHEGLLGLSDARGCTATRLWTVLVPPAVAVPVTLVTVKERAPTTAVTAQHRTEHEHS